MEIQADLSDHLRQLEELNDVQEVQEHAFYNNNKGWIRAFTLIIGIQAVLGIIMIEYALSKMKRIMNIDEKRDSQFPYSRRLDAHKWSRWKFYPGAMFSLPIRFLLLIIQGIFLLIFAW